MDEANRLTIARDAGPGNLYYTAHLNVFLPVEDIAPLDQGITVSRSYYNLDDLETPIEQTSQGEMILARLTLVVPQAVHYLVVDDPLPAGLEAVDQSLSTSPKASKSRRNTRRMIYSGVGGDGGISRMSNFATKRSSFQRATCRLEPIFIPTWSGRLQWVSSTPFLPPRKNSTFRR